MLARRQPKSQPINIPELEGCATRYPAREGDRNGYFGRVVPLGSSAPMSQRQIRHDEK